MSQDIHVEMFRQDNSSSIWLEISPAPGQRPVVRRSLGLWTHIKVTDTLATIKAKILDQCVAWYERHVNLRSYCEQAKQWRHSVRHGEETIEIKLVYIDSKKVGGGYKWGNSWNILRYKFTDDMMCIDWVCQDGLTQFAQNFFLDEVLRDIERRGQTAPAIAVAIQLLEKEFLATLPTFQDFGQMAYDALYTPGQKSAMPVMQLPLFSS